MASQITLGTAVSGAYEYWFVHRPNDATGPCMMPNGVDASFRVVQHELVCDLAEQGLPVLTVYKYLSVSFPRLTVLVSEDSGRVARA